MLENCHEFGALKWRT